jgi:putative ABC transport system substrate-binding protein
MRRREFISLLGGAAAWPIAANAQQQDERMRRIGVLVPTADDPETRTRLTAFQQALQGLGWTDGRNVHIETRVSAGNAADTRKYAAELAALAPDVILAAGSAGLPAVLQATQTVPIVFVNVPDPVGSGFVHSLSRPGGNATGFMMFEYNLCGKWPELLKEIAPGRDASGSPSRSRLSRRHQPVRRHTVCGAFGWRGGDPDQLGRCSRD